jgi:hypothetical protein
MTHYITGVEGRQPEQPPPGAWFTGGLDLGQAQDPTCLSLVQVGPGRAPAFACRYLKRYPLGTRYPDIVRDVKETLGRPPVSGRVGLAIDATGVGAGVVDLCLEAGLPGKVVPICITSGHHASADSRGYLCVPKASLVAAVQLALQSRRLTVASELPDAPVLMRELQNFRMRYTQAASVTWSAREGEHDDMVLSLALALWLAEQAAALDADDHAAESVVYT